MSFILTNTFNYPKSSFIAKSLHNSKSLIFSNLIGYFSSTNSDKAIYQCNYNSNFV